MISAPHHEMDVQFEIEQMCDRCDKIEVNKAKKPILAFQRRVLILEASG